MTYFLLQVACDKSVYSPPVCSIPLCSGQCWTEDIACLRNFRWVKRILRWFLGRRRCARLRHTWASQLELFGRYKNSNCSEQADCNIGVWMTFSGISFGFLFLMLAQNFACLCHVGRYSFITIPAYSCT